MLPLTGIGPKPVGSSPSGHDNCLTIFTVKYFSSSSQVKDSTDHGEVDTVKGAFIPAVHVLKFHFPRSILTVQSAAEVGGHVVYTRMFSKPVYYRSKSGSFFVKA